jgi:hypothetical protein
MQEETILSAVLKKKMTCLVMKKHKKHKTTFVGEFSHFFQRRKTVWADVPEPVPVVRLMNHFSMVGDWGILFKTNIHIF